MYCMQAGLWIDIGVSYAGQPADRYLCIICRPACEQVFVCCMYAGLRIGIGVLYADRPADRYL